LKKQIAPQNIMDKTQVADLTVEELRTLIRETVQKAVAEVMVEFATAAEIDAQVAYDAEISDYLRESMQQNLPLPEYNGSWKLDD